MSSFYACSFFHPLSLAFFIPSAYNQFMKDLIINKKYDGKKLNNFLFDTFPNLSSSIFYRALRKKDILVNGKRIHENITVFENDTIRIYISDELLDVFPSIPVIYEDSNILIVNKPAGIEVTNHEHSLTNMLQKKYGNFVMPCHRIDRNTFGLVLFAKTEESLSILLEKFKNREIEKHYLAQVYGIPKKDSETLYAYLFKDTKKSRVYISDIPKKGYQKIITSYTIKEKDVKNHSSILDVNLKTGRTHQIRAHLAFIGYPIIGDGKYGKNEINKKFHQKTQLLCSYKIKFNFYTDSGILNYLRGKEFSLNVFPFSIKED